MAYRAFERRHREYPPLASVTENEEGTKVDPIVPMPNPASDSVPKRPDLASVSEVNLPKLANVSEIPPMDISGPDPFRPGGEGWSQTQNVPQGIPERQSKENRRFVYDSQSATELKGAARNGASLAQTPQELIRSGMALGIILQRGRLCDPPTPRSREITEEGHNLIRSAQSMRQGKTLNLHIFDRSIEIQKLFLFFERSCLGNKKPLGTDLNRGLRRHTPSQEKF